MGSGERGTLKKLRGAARHWAHLVAGKQRRPAPQVDETVLDGMRLMGATQTDLDEARAAQLAAQQPDDDYAVHWDVWESWLFFLSVQTQWVHAGFTGARQCLNWTGIESSARMRRVPAKQLRGFADDLVEIEREVLKTDRELAAGASRKGK